MVTSVTLLVTGIADVVTTCDNELTMRLLLVSNGNTLVSAPTEVSDDVGVAVSVTDTTVVEGRGNVVRIGENATDVTEGNWG